MASEAREGGDGQAENPGAKAPRKKSVMGLQRVARDRGSFIRELQRAARARLDKRSPSD
ncbi:MAG: hypothetical protein JW895_02255 [Thermoleophilaceae bacterium]|nr:hypothetical protein [Thermoleophilaceae bacterium]